MENTPLPMSFGEINIKRGREKRGKCEEKRRKKRRGKKPKRVSEK
jgi:hypothetical protein